MVRGFVVLLMVLTLLAGFSGSTLAASDQAAERACVGDFHSTNAGPVFGVLVPGLAQAHQPFGKDVVSVGATTCEHPLFGSI